MLVPSSICAYVSITNLFPEFSLIALSQAPFYFLNPRLCYKNPFLCELLHVCSKRGYTLGLIFLHLSKLFTVTLVLPIIYNYVNYLLLYLNTVYFLH